MNPVPSVLSNGTPSSSSKPHKLGGYDFYWSIGSPKYVVAPMVDQSELAWRMLSRSPLPENMAGPSTQHSVPEFNKSFTRYPGGAHLTYTPMIHSKVFVQSRGHGRGGDGQFNLTVGEEGSEETLAGIEGGDRPLFVQFSANDPKILLAAAKKVEKHCDAVDINFGCPQGIAKRGNYGSFLQDDWELIHSLINTLHENLSIPVTAKFRIHPDVDRTIAYAKMMEAAGAQILTCHGRTREQKGQFTGLADWEIIRKVKEAVKIPVFANGNILYSEDVERCLQLTGCDGVMTAEGNLSNPALFLPPDHPFAHPPITVLATRYLDIVDQLKTPTGSSAIKSHLFRVLKPALDEEPDEKLRQMIAKCSLLKGTTEFRAVIAEIERKLKPARDADPDWHAPPIDPATGYRKLPIWVAQPYIRPPSTAPAPDPAASNANEKTMETTARAASPVPATNVNITTKCPHPSCASEAAQRCPNNQCLVHCRVHNAIQSGKDPKTAELEAKRGELVGVGCEAHEEKERARMERRIEKRKNAAEARRAHKIARKGNKLKDKGLHCGDAAGGVAEEEEMYLVNGGVAA